MSMFTVVIEEVLAQSFEVEATSPEEALEIARARYHSGEYVLEPGEVQDVRLCAMDAGGQTGEWELL